MRATTSRCSGRSSAIGFTVGMRSVNVSMPTIFMAAPPRAVDEQRSKLYHAPTRRPDAGRPWLLGYSPLVKTGRASIRVQMRGGARRPHARRTLCTLSVRPAVRVERLMSAARRGLSRSANEADGPLGAPCLVHDETAVDTQRLPRHVAGAW